MLGHLVVGLVQVAIPCFPHPTIRAAERGSDLAGCTPGLVHLKGLPLTSLAIPNDAKTDLGLKHYLAALETHAAVHDGRVGRSRGVLDCHICDRPLTAC